MPESDAEAALKALDERVQWFGDGACVIEGIAGDEKIARGTLRIAGVTYLVSVIAPHVMDDTPDLF